MKTTEVRNVLQTQNMLQSLRNGQQEAICSRLAPVPMTWPVKFGTNLTRKQVLKLENAGFQLQQQEALSPRQKFLTQMNIPIPRSRFHVPNDTEAHPSIRIGKKCCRSPHAPTANHKNRWISTGHMNGYHITGVIVVPHLGCGVGITIVNDKDKAYLVSVTTFSQCTCEDFVGMSSKAASRKWVPSKHLYYVFEYLCKMNYEIDKFITNLRIPITRSCRFQSLLELQRKSKWFKSSIGMWKLLYIELRLELHCLQILWLLLSRGYVYKKQEVLSFMY